MNTFSELDITPGYGICYSGFRDGQYPGGEIPSYEQVHEDLMLLSGRWKYLRMYDCDAHTMTVLDVIRKEKLNFKLMLGAYINAEMNNFNCPWGGGVYSEEVLDENHSESED